MKLRVLTAVPLALLVAYIVYQDRQWPFLLVLLLVVEIGLYEFFNIARQTGLGGFPFVGYLAGGIICLNQLPQLSHGAFNPFAILLLALLLTMILGFVGSMDLAKYLGAAATTMLGILYIAFALSWMVPLRFAAPEEGRQLVFFLLLVIWAGDIFAYFVGRSAGRTPFFHRISPKKTLEGAIAGLVGSMLVGFAFAHWFWPTENIKTAILLAGVVAVAGQAGDLAESALKRGANLKDSGHLLPGHGGLLDRIDSLLFGAPVLWMAWMIQELWRR
jgi:phosphatidate cytidylyltransferase